MFVGRLVMFFSFLSCVSAFTLVTSHGIEEGFPLPNSCCALREKTHQQVSDREEMLMQQCMKIRMLLCATRWELHSTIYKPCHSLADNNNFSSIYQFMKASLQFLQAYLFWGKIYIHLEFYFLWYLQLQSFKNWLVGWVKTCSETQVVMQWEEDRQRRTEDWVNRQPTSAAQRK